MDNSKKKFTGGRKYSNKDITVFWKPDACVHASYCYRELIEVFDPGRRPWVNMEGSTTEKIIEIVNLCPTEALAWKWNEEEKNEAVDKDQTNHVKFRRPDLTGEAPVIKEAEPAIAKVMIDGPIVIKGNFTLNYGGISKEIRDSLTSICRCGASNHMPFCDGMHRKIGFND